MVKANIERFTHLTERAVNDEQLSAEEAAELEAFLSSDPRLRAQYQKRIDRRQLDASMAVFIRAKDNWKNKFDKALSLGNLSRIRKRSIPLWQYYSASAAILIFLVAGWLVTGHRHKIPETPVVPIARAVDIKPGGNRAILTLSDGSSVVLDSARNGVLAQQGNSQVVKLANGQLAYRPETKSSSSNNSAAANAVGFNTISTPAGGTYQVNLPDGSKVWLNAASSIHFPTAFTGAQRDVEIAGEAYLEVVKNPGKPFRVRVRDQEVRVLGTSFNITAYSDESSIRTTLIEGAVQVARGARTVRLKPGQQAVGSTGTDRLEVNQANINNVIAWKKGFFSLDNADAETVLRQLSRWYSVEVVREGELPSVHLDGMISRDLNLSEAMGVLETHHIHCRIEAHKLIVSPK